MCRKNQKFISCATCKFQYHEKCIPSLSHSQRFDCSFCCISPQPHCGTNNQNNEPTVSEADFETTFIDESISSNSDFCFESDDEDENSRGLNFDALPYRNNSSGKILKYPNLMKSLLPRRTRTYKYPCLVCHSVCTKNQNCICCTLCDEWVHLKCTNLTVAKFNKYTDKDNSEPYYCINCLYGNDSEGNLEPPDHTSHFVINSLNPEDILDLCPNSIFNNKDDIELSEYFTIDDLNLEIKKTSDEIILIHINANSLCKHRNEIVDMLAELSKNPAIIFISETRIQDKKEEFQLPKIQIKGYTFALKNSPTEAGGTAIYVSDSLQYIERKDIKFDFPDCEACFIEIVCAHENVNPIFGALYRHPGRNARLFNTYLGEFLEMFTERKTKLTILGDININLNKSNVVSNEYMTTLTSVGFNTLINQPTRLYHYEGINTVTCSTLDHIITNCSNTFYKTGIIIADVSDHLPIFGLMKISKPCNNTLKNSFKRLFPIEKKENFVKSLKANLDKVDLNSLDPNYLMVKILLATKDAIDQNFPYKKVTRKEAKLILNPWMTKEILKERKIRDDLKMKFCKHKIVNSEDHINYKRYRNKVRIMIRDARRKYTLNDCKKAKGSSKKMWKVIRKATNDNPKPSIIPDFVKTKTTYRW